MAAIVVTGGAGFLGTKLNKVASSYGHDSFTVDLNFSDSNQNLEKELNLPDEVANQKPVLVHLASPMPGSLARGKLLAATTAITKNLLLHQDLFSKAVVVSSTAVYKREGIRLGEQNPEIGPWEAYGEAKLQMEREFLDSAMPVEIIRPGTMLGPGRTGGIVSLISRLRAGKLTPLPSKGKLVHPFVHVDDVVGEILACCARQSIKLGVTDVVASEPLPLDEAIYSAFRKDARIWPAPDFVFRIGSDRFPVRGLSSWHTGALLYDLAGWSPSAGTDRKTTVEALLSVA